MKTDSKVYTKYVGTVLWFTVYALHRGMASGRIGTEGKDGPIFDFSLSDICHDTLKLTGGRLIDGDVVEFWASAHSGKAHDVKLINRQPKKKIYGIFDRWFRRGEKETLALIERPRHRVEA